MSARDAEVLAAGFLIGLLASAVVAAFAGAESVAFGLCMGAFAFMPFAGWIQQKRQAEGGAK